GRPGLDEPLSRSGEQPVRLGLAALDRASDSGDVSALVDVSAPVGAPAVPGSGQSRPRPRPGGFRWPRRRLPRCPPRPPFPVEIAWLVLPRRAIRPGPSLDLTATAAVLI